MVHCSGTFGVLQRYSTRERLGVKSIRLPPSLPFVDQVPIRGLGPTPVSRHRLRIPGHEIGETL